LAAAAAWPGDGVTQSSALSDLIVSLADRARDSLFLIPATIILVLGLASRGAIWVDGVVIDAPLLLPTTVDSARSILATVATATVTVAAVVFSMTAVVVQLATSQYSPRVTQGFLRDRYQQVTIGLTIGTFVYALLVLASVRGSELVPDTSHDFSVTMGLVLAVVSAMAIVSFIDRIMRSMRIDTIVRRLADRTEESIAALPLREPVPEDAGGPRDTDTATHVDAPRSGWVESIDVDRILSALPGATTIRLDVRVGESVAHDEGLAEVWPEIGPSAAHRVGAAVAVGRTRSIGSDPAHGIRQLVDIALRALSPALNDPTTAADVVHHLTGPLRTALVRDLPGRVVKDDRGNRVYMPRTLTHSDYVHGALREIRIRALDQPHVLRALLESISSLIEVLVEAGLEGRTGALRDEAEATLEVVERSTMTEADKRHLRSFARTVGLAEE
jgi:uncharacterized membrane protein